VFEKFLQSARPNLQKAFFKPALGKEQQGTGKEELYDKKTWLFIICTAYHYNYRSHNTAYFL